MVVDFVNDRPGPDTFNVADAVLPVPPFVEVTAPLVLGYVPPPAVTLTVTVQELFAVMVPPANVTEVDVLLKVPPQVVVGALATVRPVGNESVNPTPVSENTLFGFVIVKVKVGAGSPTVIELGENDLIMDGGAITFRVADAVLPVPPLVEVTAPLVFK